MPDAFAAPEDPTLTEFLGFRFRALDAKAALAMIAERADRAQPFVYVATPNADHCVKLARESALRAPLYADAHAVINDSRIIAWLAKRSGLQLPAVPGSDLAAALFERVITPAHTIAIIGGEEAMIETIARRFGLHDVRWHQPPMGLRDDPGAIERAAAFIAAQRAHFVFIGVGAPQQEMIARAVRQRGDAVGVGLCFGAALEFLAGHKARAPAWMQKAGLEWLHRLASEPGRLWRRYLVDGPEIFMIWRRWLSARKRGR